MLSNAVQYTSENSGSHCETENNSNKSLSPENFEVIEQPNKNDSPKSKSRGSIVTLDDDGSAGSFNVNENDWTNVVLPLESERLRLDSNKNEDNQSIKSEVVHTMQHSQSFR